MQPSCSVTTHQFGFAVFKLNTKSKRSFYSQIFWSATPSENIVSANKWWLLTPRSLISCIVPALKAKILRFLHIVTARSCDTTIFTLFEKLFLGCHKEYISLPGWHFAFFITFWHKYRTVSQKSRHFRIFMTHKVR